MSATTSADAVDEVLPHDEYYFYVIDHEDEPRCLHLTEAMVADMREMVAIDFPSEAGSWYRTCSFDLGDGIWFEFNPADPTQSKFMFKQVFGGEERVFGSVFKQEVWFDSGFLCESTGPPADKRQHHYKRFRDEVVLDEHVDQYREALFEWEQNGGWETDWIDWDT